MKFSLRNWVLMILMIISSIIATSYTPSKYLSATRKESDLEVLIPKSFGDWHELEQSRQQVVNPQANELLNKLYQQTLARTYVNSQGNVVMLSIAYGINQSDSMTMHYPEVCYPAQGFSLQSNKKFTLNTDLGNIKAKRLIAQLGQRHEPITYWTTLGNHVTYSGLETKLRQIEYGLNGLISDGLLFRVSSITSDSNKAFEIQNAFIESLLHVIRSEDRPFIAGL